MDLNASILNDEKIIYTSYEINIYRKKYTIYDTEFINFRFKYLF